MLEQVLDHIHNYFVIKKVSGEFTIESGTIGVDFLQENQYFYITGSVFNDGLHKYPDLELVDETFEGQIWAMAVPLAVVSLSEEIAKWSEKNGNNSPYTSESFKGYSYTKNTNSSGSPIGWREIFKSRLDRWRKIA